MRKNIGMHLVILLVSVLFSFGGVTKKEDPVLKTQTDPIAYKDKMEEVKDGEKGAPLPSFTLYPREPFLVDPPMAPNKDEGVQRGPKLPEDESSIPEESEVFDLGLEKEMLEESQEEEVASEELKEVFQRDEKGLMSQGVNDELGSTEGEDLQSWEG